MKVLSFDEYLNLVDAPVEEDLVKAVFKHAYYSKLVPQVILGKDGVKRIHWVRPDKDIKNAKINPVAVFHEGDREEHHEKIKAEHEIDLDHVHYFSHGDRVRVTAGRHKGEVGIFVGAYPNKKNASPRASVKFKDVDGKWKTGNPVGIGSMELVHRGNRQTKEAIAPKTVEHITKKGKRTLVTKKWKDKVGNLAPKETAQEKYKRMAKEIHQGAVFQRVSDGSRVFIVSEKEAKLHIKILNAKKKSGQTEGWVERERFEKLVADKTYFRSNTAKKNMADKKTKPLTAKLESGESHFVGDVSFNEIGRPTLDPEVATGIIFENWDLIGRVISAEVSKYSTVDSSDVSGVDFLDKLKNAIETWEPFLNTSLYPRLYKYAQDAARKKASAIHEINVMRDNHQDVAADSSTAGTITREEAGDPTDLGATGFVNRLDALTFKEAIKEEAEAVEWLVGNDEFVDALTRMIGLGYDRPQISRKEAVRELHGKVVGENGKLLNVAAIESRLSNLYDRLVEGFQKKAEENPNFSHSLWASLELRSKMRRKRVEEDYKNTAPTMEAVRKIYDGGRNARSTIASKLIRYGASISDAPKMVQTVEKIIDGKVLPEDYHKIVKSPEEAKILESALKDMIPDSAADNELPEQFKVVKWHKNPRKPVSRDFWL